jgi:DMSO reductase anchor subunit
MSDSTGILPLALLLALAGELIGRWLFFITVTPKNIASSFICEEQAA